MNLKRESDNPNTTQMNGKPIGLIVCMPTRGGVAIETTLCLRKHVVAARGSVRG
jgi:hypothetical protein